MVFSSVPVYLDPPNWQQQQPNHHHQQQQQGGGSDNHHQHHHHQHHHHQNPQLPPPPPPPQSAGSGSQGSIRPGSMADRARLAKIPQPEASLKCPRCESTNTKFCYFNNYSLTQPRHFCKTCRRYWTRGGALRNVPVGGGCRRNKRSKGSRSKSPAPERQTGSCSTSTVSSNSCSTTDMIAHLPHNPPPQLPFLPSLHHLSEYGSGVDMGLNFAGIQPQVVSTGAGGSGSGADVEFQIGGGSGSGVGSLLASGVLAEQWRLQQQVQQFPFLANLEPPTGLYPFEGENVKPTSYVGGAGQLRSKPLDSSVTGAAHQLGGGGVKMEENNQGLNMSRNFLGGLGNDQYWGGGGNAWTATDLSAFNSSSTTHLL